MSLLSLVTGYFLAPETVSAITDCGWSSSYIQSSPRQYAPVLLRRRAKNLALLSSGAISYMSKYDINRSTSFTKIMRVNLSRPFTFLVTEPIVLLLAIYISVVYGTLYALFSAFPIVFQTHRGWTAGEGGLAFLGVGAGISASCRLTIFSVVYGIFFSRYIPRDCNCVYPEPDLLEGDG